jgi:hypothetical protein
MKPPRTPLFGIPDVVIHRADESVVKVHANYGAAKAGDIESAKALVSSFVNDSGIERLKRLIGGRFPELVPIHALEAEGVSVGHTGASGFARLAHQARFDGEIERGTLYLVVDDFVGQGGTLALTLEPSRGNLEALRRKHGKDLEDWWIQEFGFDFDCLTRSEAHYLERTADAHTVRSRLIEVDDAHHAMREFGFRTDDFEILEQPHPSPILPGAIKGAVVVSRRSNAVHRTYAGGHGSQWPTEFREHLKNGVFGSAIIERT